MIVRQDVQLLLHLAQALSQVQRPPESKSPLNKLTPMDAIIAVSSFNDAKYPGLDGSEMAVTCLSDICIDRIASDHNLSQRSFNIVQFTDQAS